MPKPKKNESVDLSHPALEEGQIAIQRLPIWLPGFIALVKYEPKYVFPLYKMLWKMRDPKAPIKDPNDITPRIESAYPAGISWKEAWLILDEEDAVDVERARLLAYFGNHPNGEKLFDVVYPGDSFDTAFESAKKPSLAAVSASAANPAIADLATLDAVGEGLANKLFDKGIRSVREVALATDDELAKILGKVRGPKAKADAEKRFEMAPTE